MFGFSDDVAVRLRSLLTNTSCRSSESCKTGMMRATQEAFNGGQWTRSETPAILMSQHACIPNAALCGSDVEQWSECSCCFPKTNLQFMVIRARSFINLLPRKRSVGHLACMDSNMRSSRTSKVNMMWLKRTTAR